MRSSKNGGGSNGGSARQSGLPWALLSFSRKMQMWNLIISISSLAFIPLSEICCRQGPRRMGAQSFWSSAIPLNGRHNLDIQKTGVKYPKHMPAAAVWCNLTMIGLELPLREARCWYLIRDPERRENEAGDNKRESQAGRHHGQVSKTCLLLYLHVWAVSYCTVLLSE